MKIKVELLYKNRISEFSDLSVIGFKNIASNGYSDILLNLYKNWWAEKYHISPSRITVKTEYQGKNFVETSLFLELKPTE